MFVPIVLLLTGFLVSVLWHLSENDLRDSGNTRLLPAERKAADLRSQGHRASAVILAALLLICSLVNFALR